MTAPRSGVRARAGHSRARPGRRARPIVLAGLAAIVVAGCATKQDIRDLRADVESVRVRQDSVFSMLAAQNRAILDSINASAELMVGVRGDLGHRLLRMEEQLIQIQELTGQGQRRLSQLRQDFQEQQQRTAERGRMPDTAAAAASDTAGGGETVGAAEELYRVGMDHLRRGAPGTARRAFERFVRNYPNHDLAPDAQFQLAETWAQEGEFDAALGAFERVVELYPGSGRAPHALYRAGVIAHERGNIPEARAYFQKVVDGYPDSDVARSASDRLSDIGTR